MASTKHEQAELTDAGIWPQLARYVGIAVGSGKQDDVYV